MAEKGRIDGIDFSPREEQRRRKSESYWHMSFLAFSMGLFMCVTSSLTLVTVIANFAVSYQTRDVLFETLSNDSFSAVPVPYQSSTAPTITTVIAEQISTDMAAAEREELRKIGREEADVILAQLNDKATNEAYLCAKTCDDPPVINAKLNLTLSLLGENYIVLEAKVATENEQIAKRRVAYWALDYVYKENVIDAIYDAVWDTPVPPPVDCNVAVTQFWRKCKT